MSTAVSTGLGESLAVDKMLISGQKSAIFDLALLAPGLISSDSDSEITIPLPSASDGTSKAEGLISDANPVEMPTGDLMSIMTETGKVTAKGPPLSANAMTAPSADLIDKDITQALAALAALEHTGRSSLVPQKANADVLPSILKARLGLETPDSEAPSLSIHQPEPSAAVLNFPVTSKSGASEARTQLIGDEETIAPEEPIAPSLSNAQDHSGEVAAVQQNPKENDTALNADIIKVPVLAVAPNIALKEPIKALSAVQEPSAESAAPKIGVATIAPALSELPIPQAEIATKITSMTMTASSSEPQSVVISEAREHATPSRAPITISGLVESLPAVEEAQRDDRPAFIGDLIETPKPIILPNQPMPVAQRVPLSDPQPLAQHPAFVFKNDAFAEQFDGFSPLLASHELSAVRLITNEEGIPTTLTLRADAASVTTPDALSLGASLVNSDYNAGGLNLTLASSDEKFAIVEMINASEIKGALETPNIITAVKSQFSSEATVFVGKAAQTAVNDKAISTDFVVKSFEKKTSKIKTNEASAQENDSAAAGAENTSTMTSMMTDSSVFIPAPSTLQHQTLNATEKDASDSNTPEHASKENAFDQATSPQSSNSDRVAILPTRVAATADHAEKNKIQKDGTISALTRENIATQIALKEEIDQAQATIDTAIHAENKKTIGSDHDSASIKENATFSSHNAPASGAMAFENTDTQSEQKNASHHHTPAVLINSLTEENNDEHTSRVVPDLFEAKAAIISMTSAAPSEPDHREPAAPTITDINKIATEASTINKSGSDAIRDVTLVVRQSDIGDHAITNTPAFAQTIAPSDYHTGLSSTPMTGARETTAAPTYASSDNPLFQIQRDRAVEAQVIAALKSGRDEVRLSLYPPQLGQVTINLALDGTKVKVALKTSNREASDLLTAEQPSLSHALQLEGFTLEGFDVTEDDSQNNRKNAPDATIKTPIPASSGSSEFSIDITI